MSNEVAKQHMYDKCGLKSSATVKWNPWPKEVKIYCILMIFPGVSTTSRRKQSKPSQAGAARWWLPHACTRSTSSCALLGQCTLHTEYRNACRWPASWLGDTKHAGRNSTHGSVHLYSSMGRGSSRPVSLHAHLVLICSYGHTCVVMRYVLSATRYCKFMCYVQDFLLLKAGS